MEKLYSFLGITRQSLYNSKIINKSISKLENDIIFKVEKFRSRHPKMGSRSLYSALNISEIGVTKFEQLISKRGLTVAKRKKRIVTTDSKGSMAFPNLINGLILNNINQLIVADITYYKIEGQDLYIFTLKDVYSQRVLSLQGCDNMRAINAINTIKDFIKARGKGPFPGLIHHSDNGKQYDADIFKSMILKLGMVISRARNSLENGSSESLNNIVKNQYLFDRKSITSLKKLRTELDKLKWKLNNEKPIKSLGYMTVIEFENHIINLPKEKRPTKKLYDFNKER